MRHAQRWKLLSTLVLVLGATGCTTPVAPTAAAEPPDQTTAQIATGQMTTAQLKARCSQLISFYDRWAVSRSNDSDGRRNFTRLSAEFDCRRGLYAEGIATMDNLIRVKKFTPPPSGLPDLPPDED